MNAPKSQSDSQKPSISQILKFKGIPCLKRHTCTDEPYGHENVHGIVKTQDSRQKINMKPDRHAVFESSREAIEQVNETSSTNHARESIKFLDSTKHLKLGSGEAKMCSNVKS